MAHASAQSAFWQTLTESVIRATGAVWLLIVVLTSGWLPAQQVAIATRAEHVIAHAKAQDAGAVAGSQMVTLTLHLAPTAAKEAALDHFLLAQTDHTSPDYHRWFSPQEFGDRYGVTEQQREQLSDWLLSNGLAVIAQTNSGRRITVSGSVAAAERAFSVSLRRMTTRDQIYFANEDAPRLPNGLALLVSSISGLDDLPSAADDRLHLAVGPVQGSEGETAVSRAAAQATMVATGEIGSAAKSVVTGKINDVTAAIESAIDENVSPVLSLESTLCSDDLSVSERATLRADIRQAQAQGITVLVAGSCSRGDAPAFPSDLSAVTAATLAPQEHLPETGLDLETRPVWQAAPGLPVDGLRHSPDFKTSSLGMLAHTVTMLVQESGARLGNLSPTLYALAKSPGLFTQSEAAADSSAEEAGSWRASTGLGTIDLETLLRIYPRGLISTSTSLVSSSYALNYGDSFTLTATVQAASVGTTNPSGTITFTSSLQGVLGSATLSNGTATLTQTLLPVGKHVVTATYSGDGTYVTSTSTMVTITVSIVNAKVTATIAPQTNVPYGATATVTATVTLPGANATPDTTVTAQIQGVGALGTATLSPNAGGNSATANILISVPPPSSNYTVQVTCMGTSNFQCQSPANLSLGVVKGYTTVTTSVLPASPQAGQSVALTATVANAGNGTGTYAFTGSVTFYDAGKLVGMVPVATNQATTNVTLSGGRVHSIVAIYSGDSNWNTSTSGAVGVTPTILPDVVMISSSAASGTSLSGVNIVLTGTASTTITYGVGPTGTITFFDTFNGAIVQLGNPATMVANGTNASIGLFGTTGLLPGVHHIYAVYSGDSNYAAAQSPVLQLSITNFSVNMTPTSLNLSQGKSQQVTVLIGASGGFAGTVSLGCIPPPSSEASCSFSPSSVTGGGATTLTISTTAASAAVRHVAQAAGKSTPGGVAPELAGTTSFGAVLCLLGMRRSRRMLLDMGARGLLGLLLACTMILASAGCGLGVLSSSNGSSSGGSSGDSGGSGNGSTSDPGTPLGTQNFTITAATSDGVNAVSHTYQYQVTVQ